MDLAARAKSAVKWAASLTLLAQLFKWAITIVVIRLLSPDDYGLMAMSMVFIGLAMIVNEMGLGSALIQRPNLQEAEIRAAHGFILVLNLGLYALFFFCARWIALFFDETLLESIIPVAALLFPILGFEVVALSLLEKNLEFKKKTGVYLVASVTGGIVSLLFALSGAGVWSLIYGNLVSALIKAVAINALIGRMIIPSLNLTAVRPMLGFGGVVATERILWHIHSQADVFLIGKILGKEQLGYYYVALHLASLAYHKTGGLLYAVSLPIFADAQVDIAVVRRFFVKALRIVSFVAFPFLFGLAAVSFEAVDLILGTRWGEAAPLLLILSLSMPARIIGNLFPPALQGTGHAKSSLVNLMIAVMIMVPALAIGAAYGTTSVALIWLTVYPVVIIVIINRSKDSLGVHWSDVRQAIVTPIFASLVMLGTVLFIGPLLADAGLSVVTRFPLMILVGVFIFAALTVLGMRDQLREILNIIRRD